ncbi:HAD family hydrolase [Methanopyrus kandleri]|uniref:HAD family hydrolase, a n=1 Tax=Methanopyrus kandleri (strain AV19 / DSM 6324 / JCM 9639 / NBRC 100938) TaxID=190192 RepID=Q8TXY0_METKA|nr:HAD family hydrolase [Methanopyrus kandleri]AAM01744.1 HAD family hydrolase, a fragment [Methanopyrus kandleri AV19]
MIEVEIPGRGELRLEHLVLDYNGTIASGGKLLESVVEPLQELTEIVHVVVASADTYGTVEDELNDAGLDIEVYRVSAGNEREDKAELIEELGPEVCAAVGNGANDELMLRRAALGICVIGPEGACSRTLLNAHVVVREPREALELLLDPKALRATMRC